MGKECGNLVRPKLKRITIEGDVQTNYTDNEFKYVHPFLDDVDKEI